MNSEYQPLYDRINRIVRLEAFQKINPDDPIVREDLARARQSFSRAKRRAVNVAVKGIGQERKWVKAMNKEDS